MRHVGGLTTQVGGWHWQAMVFATAPFATVFNEIRQRAASVLVLLAMAVQALVPVGYMLGSRPIDGSVAITLCTSNGMISAFIDANGQISETKSGPHIPSPRTDGDTSVCAFVGHNGSVFGANQSALALPATNFEVVTSELAGLTLDPDLGLAAPPPPKTGPPIQV